jgi:hypothetical protein
MQVSRMEERASVTSGVGESLTAKVVFIFSGDL